jgi:hypothetical protein
VHGRDTWGLEVMPGRPKHDALARKRVADAGSGCKPRSPLSTKPGRDRAGRATPLISRVSTLGALCTAVALT